MYLVRPHPNQILLALVVVGCSVNPKPTEVSFRPGEHPDLQPRSARGADPDSPDLSKRWSRGFGIGKGVVSLSVSPVSASRLDQIIPMGMMQREQVLPSDYLEMRVANPQERCTVVAPADGRIVLINHTVPSLSGEGSSSDYERYRVVIEHSSTFWTVSDNLNEIDPSIRAQLPERTAEGFPWFVRISVKAGQPVGYIENRAVQFSVINSATKVSAATVVEHYVSAPWKLHAVDPVAQFSTKIRTQLAAKSARKIQPLGGRANWDTPNSLLGNWFAEGTRFVDAKDNGSCNWSGHLAIANHPIESKRLVLSLGNFGGRPIQFWVLPAENNGLVRATVGKLYRFVVTEIEAEPNQNDVVAGTMLAKLADSKTIQFELFLNARPETVTAFTGAMRTFTR